MNCSCSEDCGLFFRSQELSSHSVEIKRYTFFFPLLWIIFHGDLANRSYLFCHLSHFNFSRWKLSIARCYFSSRDFVFVVRAVQCSSFRKVDFSSRVERLINPWITTVCSCFAYLSTRSRSLLSSNSIRNPSGPQRSPLVRRKCNLIAHGATSRERTIVT